MCCLEKPKGRQKEGSEARTGRGGGGGGGPPCLKTRKKGGRGKRGADRQRRFRSGGEGRLAGAVAGSCLWREGAEPG